MKKVLITGANKGIGLELTRQLIQKGYYVYMGSRDLAGLECSAKIDGSRS
jgi:short-subunit dehydrogenase